MRDPAAPERHQPRALRGRRPAAAPAPLLRPTPTAARCTRAPSLQSLVQDVIPFVEKNFRALTDKNNRAIAGLSMGGAHTVMTTSHNPGVFGWIGVFSAGLNMDNADLTRYLTKVKAGGVQRYWTGAGTTDFALKDSQILYETAKRVGLNVGEHRLVPGAHFWFIWRLFLSEYAPLLFR